MKPVPINGMTLNKELRDKQMTGVGQEGDPMFSVRSSGHQHAVGFYSNQGSLGQGNNEELSPTLKAAETTNHAAVAVVNMGGDKGGASVKTDGTCFTLSTNEPHAVGAFQQCSGSPKAALSYRNETAPSLTGGQDHQMCHTGMAVRRLTPKECERLQGFPDNHTLIPWRGKPAEQCPDGPRYKALGNSMAVPCMAWIGSRIAAQESESLRYLSVCSGIEAASMAWEPLGWQPAAFAEVEKFPSAVLAHHWPQVPNMGDMNNHEQWDLPAIDVLVGGTPCQSFSVAGLRKGLRDPRGGLMLTFLEIAQRRRPRWIVWENVPGVLSSNGGRDFGSFLGALGSLGYGWAYRILDAQWCGVAQRRRRVFVIANLGDGASPAKVLFESESVRRNPAPSREAGERTAETLVRGAKGSGGIGYDNQALFSQNGDNFVRPSDYPEVVGTLSDGAHQGGGLNGQDAYTGRIFACARQPADGADGQGHEHDTGRGADGDCGG